MSPQSVNVEEWLHWKSIAERHFACSWTPSALTLAVWLGWRGACVLLRITSTASCMLGNCSSSETNLPPSWWAIRKWGQVKRRWPRTCLLCRVYLVPGHFYIFSACFLTSIRWAVCSAILPPWRVILCFIRTHFHKLCFLGICTWWQKADTERLPILFLLSRFGVVLFVPPGL